MRGAGEAVDREPAHFADFGVIRRVDTQVELAQPVVVAGPQVGLPGADGMPGGGAAIGVGVNPLGERPPLGVPGGLVAVGDPGRRAGDFADVGATVGGVAEGPERLEGEGLVVENRPSRRCWFGRDGRCHGAPAAEEASNPYGATRPKAVVLPGPGVSWINLPSQRYQGPEERSRRLPILEAVSNTATGLPVVSGIHATSGQIAHQRKLGHLEVPVSSSTVSRSSINSGLGWPNCAAPPLLVIARSYRLPNIPSWSDPSTGCTRSRTLEHGEDQLLASVQRRPRRSVAEPDVRDARAVLTSYQGRAPRVLFSWDRRPEVLGWFRHRPSRGLTDRHALVKLRQEVLEVGHLLNAVIEPRFSHRPGPHPGRQ